MLAHGQSLTEQVVGIEKLSLATRANDPTAVSSFRPHHSVLRQLLTAAVAGITISH